MKNTICHILTVACMIILTASCKTAPYTPEAAPNPWPDDYEQLSGMENYSSWGTYNVHDPAVCRVGDTFYMYSTDAIYKENKREAEEKNVPLGFIQVRKSNDLVNWDFVGWAFSEIPTEAKEWVRSLNDGHGATNIWAPYMFDCGNGKYRLYYCVSAFGRKTSYIGLAESNSPEGPWKQIGAVVKTDNVSPMNAIDPTIINTDNKMFMIYGSFFGGIYCVELDKATGLPAVEGDQGKLVARRANYRKDNLEAPEIIVNPENGMYYLFGSYDPLMTTYNVRVGRSANPDGPFEDFYGKNLADTTDNYPILTAPYNFKDHAGWVGTGHCGVFSDKEGKFYMAHQGRLASNPGMMDLHVRQVFFTPGGWPVVSPERYAGTPGRTFRKNDLAGEWEIIRIHEPRADRNLEAGQILWGEGALLEGESCTPETLVFDIEGKIGEKGSWDFDEEKQLATITLGDETIKDIITFAGHDWEREQNTILMSGLDDTGRAFWAKRVK